MTLPMAAWRAQYAPGEQLVLAGPKMLVAMTPPPERYSEQVEQLWIAMLQAPSVDALVTLVAELGLGQVPKLGALFWDEGNLHGLTRGGVRVVDSDTGLTVLEGSGTLTWREDSLGQNRRLRLELGSAAPAVARLPLAAGVVYVSEVHLSTAAEDQLRLADPVSASAPLNAPAPIAEPAAPAPVAAPASVLDSMPAPEPAPIPEPAPESLPSMANTPEPWVVSASPEPESWDASAHQVFVDEAAAERISSPLEVAQSLAADANLSPSFALDADTEAGEISAPPIPVPALGVTPPVAAPGVGIPPVPGVPPVAPAGRAEEPPAQPVSEPPPPAEEIPAEAQVLAVPCSNGHANPPNARGCRLCNSPIAPVSPRLIRKPVLAGVHTNKGDFAEIREGVIVGRAPAPGSGPAGAHLMRVISPSNDISRNHVLITTKDWDVLVTDLHSTNGTTVIPVDGPPFTIRDGMVVTVGINTVLDLGDGVSLRIEQPRG